MAYFRHLDANIASLLNLLDRDGRWLIIINADPDALASAMALRRIMIHRVQAVNIARINEITRPDNLAMMRYLRIPDNRLTPTLAAQYDHFALVDSQPHHNPAYRDFKFSIVMDHHPLSKDRPVDAEFVDIQPHYGANSTLMTEYLYNLNIRPGKLLATALLFGIKTDTMSFERDFCDVDARAFRYLSKFRHEVLLRKITRSEFHMDWLRYFQRGFMCMEFIKKGLYTYMHEVENPDVLVVLADFFMRVHEISWVCVAGVYDDKLVLIFRGDGLSRSMGDVGKAAKDYFSKFGSAGGHKTMARAELPLENIEEGDYRAFVRKRLSRRARPAKKAENAAQDADTQNK